MKLPRLFALIVLNVLLLGMIFVIAPQQAPVTLYKLSLVTLAGLVGYWLDRALFPYARPDIYIDKAGFKVELFACMLRRAIIVGCAMLAMGLGA